VLRHKSRIGQALAALRQESQAAGTRQDADFLRYAGQVEQHFLSLDAFYDAYRLRYVPYALAVSEHNAAASQGAGRAGSGAPQLQQLQLQLAECTPQPPAALDPAALRYPPAVYHAPPTIAQMKRERFQQQARLHVERAPPPRRAKPSPLSPPLREDMLRPEAFVHPSPFD
jgi:hypothetical protein